MSKTKTEHRNISAITGRYVTEHYAATHNSTTVKQTVHVPVKTPAKPKGK
jgi:hypothetical protein